MEIKNIVFDLGDVLVKYRNEGLLAEIGIYGDEAQRIVKETIWDEYGIWEARDRGQIDNDEMIRRYGEAFPDDFEAIQYFIENEERGVETNEETWELVHALKQKGYRIYILSNYAKEPFYKQALSNVFMEDIDGGIVSYMTGSLKPEKEIYSALLENYGLVPGETVFFDDLEKNVQQARLLGIRAVRVTSQEMLRDQLRKLIKTSSFRKSAAA